MQHSILVLPETASMCRCLSYSWATIWLAASFCNYSWAWANIVRTGATFRQGLKDLGTFLHCTAASQRLGMGDAAMMHLAAYLNTFRLHFHLTSLHLTSPHFTSLHLTSPHFTSLHTSLHLTSHFTSLHPTSPHFASLHSTSFHTYTTHRDRMRYDWS